MTLSASIACEECRDFFAAVPTGEAISRSWVNEIHWSHRPMHPNEVGAKHRRAAKVAYDAWEAASPYREDSQQE